MTVKANGTDAKDVALHFVKRTSDSRSTPSIIAKTTNQAKILLQNGYTKKEIISVIDYIIDVKKIDIYSLGYINTCINNMIKEINKLEEEQKVKELKRQREEELSKISLEQQSEVNENGESTQRNRDKLNRFGSKSRVGEKFDFDMFKGQQ